MEGEGSDPTDDLHGRESLTPVFENLNTYEATMHFNGQSTVAIDGDHATGYTYCIANHVYSEDSARKLMVAHLRYRDTILKEDGAWLFAERRLYLDWAETLLSGDRGETDRDLDAAGKRVAKPTQPKEILREHRAARDPRRNPAPVSLPPGSDVNEQRRLLRELLSAQPLPPDVTVTPAALGGVPTAEITVDGIEPRHVVLTSTAACT